MKIGPMSILVVVKVNKCYQGCMLNIDDAELNRMADEDYDNHHDICEECDAQIHTFGYPCDCGAAEGTKVSCYFLCPTHAARSGALLRKAGTAETLRMLDIVRGSPLEDR